MAPPANRRSGHSRRAQYSTFFGYIAGVLGAVIGAALLILSIWNPGLFSGFRSVASEASEPVGGAAARTRSAGYDVWSTIEGYALAGSRYDKLNRELADAKVKLAKADAVASENRRLKDLLGLVEREPKPITVTRITGSTASSGRRFVTIGAGSSEGVEDGMPVRSSLGLVGRVLETGSSSARVLLITDTESTVPVRRAKDGIPAFAQGRGDGSLQIRLIDLGINPLRKGDVMVTSGTGGLYWPGTPIAVVTRITRDGAIARIISDPASTDYVTVEPIRAPEAIDPLDAKAGAADPE